MFHYYNAKIFEIDPQPFGARIAREWPKPIHRIAVGFAAVMDLAFFSTGKLIFRGLSWLYIRMVMWNFRKTFLEVDTSKEMNHLMKWLATQKHGEVRIIHLPTLKPRVYFRNANDALMFKMIHR